MVDRKLRVKMIQALRDDLKMRGQDDIDLLLSSFEFPQGDWNYEMTTQDSLVNGTDEQLLALYDHLFGEDDIQPSTAGDFASPLSVFASHLARHKATVGQYEQSFRRLGIELFVAHVSIPDDAAWQEAIQQKLTTAHAGLVFLHDGFNASQWCDQEVGWMLGRGIPVPSIKFEMTDPYGPLGRKQAINPHGKQVDQVVAQVLTVYRSYPALHPHLAESHISALEQSLSYRMTDQIWTHLKDLDSINAEQAERLLRVSSTEGNAQVGHAPYPFDASGRRYAEVIREFVESKRST
jgi:hypothetical protein